MDDFAIDRIADAEAVGVHVEAGLSVRAICETTGWQRWRAERAVELYRILRTLRAPPGQRAVTPEAEEPGGIGSYPFEESFRSRHILERVVPQSSRIRRFIFTHADPAAAPENLFPNLLAYSEHLNAELVIGCRRRKLKFYPSDLQPYLCPDRVRISPSCLFIGDTGMSSTAKDPVARYSTKNGGDHVIVPHPRVALKSIPRMSCHPARYAVSTGSATVPSYSDTETGQDALFHHVAGALVVEVDTDGECFFRHVIADRDGSFQDLDCIVKDGVVLTGQRIDGVVWGDIHLAAMSRPIGLSSFGWDVEEKRATGAFNLLDWLRPSWQLMADGLDFPSRHRLAIESSTEMARMYFLGRGDVRQEVRDAADFYNACVRPWSDLRLTEDNHGAKFVKWIDGDRRKDPLPQNGGYAGYLFSKKTEMIEADPLGFRAYQIVEAALRDEGMSGAVEVIYRGQSFAPGGIEVSIHSHKGINGASGNPSHYRGFGKKVTLTHPHTPIIDSGMVSAGTCAEIPEVWNPDSTTHANAHVLHYGTGKRCLLTMTPDGRFRATGRV